MQPIANKRLRPLKLPFFLKKNPVNTAKNIPISKESDKFFVKLELKKLSISVSKLIALRITSKKFLREG
jgi:hypothetical protein